MVSPENRALEIDGRNFGYGGIGNDILYGTDSGDNLVGEYLK